VPRHTQPPITTDRMRKVGVGVGVESWSLELESSEDQGRPEDGVAGEEDVIFSGDGLERGGAWRGGSYISGEGR